MSDSTQLTELESGVRVVTEVVPSVRSVALGLWVRTGSRNETHSQEGVSHFLEHMLFKGTEEHSAIEISEIFDGLGASVNAATGKETTHLHARFLDEHTEAAFKLLGEMLLNSTYAEVDSEREVVLEEIAMYDDEPMDRVHDFLAEAVFGDHPLGRRILGRSEVIAAIPVPEIDAYHDGHYVAPNLVVAAAGNVDHAQICELAGKFIVPPQGAAPNGNGARAAVEPRLLFHEKDTEQYHICFGGPGLKRDDDRRYAMEVFDSIFGGSSSSRLFVEVREKRGLAYSVGSYNDKYTDAGIVATYVGTREDNVEEACAVIATELERLRAEPISAEELARGKEHLKGRTVLGSESTASRMTRLARAVLFDLPLYSLDEILEKIDAVTVDDVTALCEELYDPSHLSAACIGRDEKLFRSAVAGVAEPLAAASK